MDFIILISVGTVSAALGWVAGRRSDKRRRWCCTIHLEHPEFGPRASICGSKRCHPTTRLYSAVTCARCARLEREQREAESLVYPRQVDWSDSPLNGGFLKKKEL